MPVSIFENAPQLVTVTDNVSGTQLFSDTMGKGSLFTFPATINFQPYTLVISVSSTTGLVSLGVDISPTNFFGDHYDMTITVQSPTGTISTSAKNVRSLANTVFVGGDPLIPPPPPSPGDPFTPNPASSTPQSVEVNFAKINQ